jgi:hypothetical protein
MLQRQLAQQLKALGLAWNPHEGDSFMIPDRGLDDQIYTINTNTTMVQEYFGEPMLMFHGTSEWALDNVHITEAVWLPTETQLREIIAERIGPDSPLRLDRMSSGYRCMFAQGADLVEFEAESAEGAYALGLIALLEAA